MSSPSFQKNAFGTQFPSSGTRRNPDVTGSAPLFREPALKKRRTDSEERRNRGRYDVAALLQSLRCAGAAPEKRVREVYSEACEASTDTPTIEAGISAVRGAPLPSRQSQVGDLNGPPLDEDTPAPSLEQPPSQQRRVSLAAALRPGEWARARNTLVKQHGIFAEQVAQLHALAQRQRDLSREEAPVLLRDMNTLPAGGEGALGADVSKGAADGDTECMSRSSEVWEVGPTGPSRCMVQSARGRSAVAESKGAEGKSVKEKGRQQGRQQGDMKGHKGGSKGPSAPSKHAPDEGGSGTPSVCSTSCASDPRQPRQQHQKQQCRGQGRKSAAVEAQWEGKRKHVGESISKAEQSPRSHQSLVLNGSMEEASGEAPSTTKEKVKAVKDAKAARVSANSAKPRGSPRVGAPHWARGYQAVGKVEGLPAVAHAPAAPLPPLNPGLPPPPLGPSCSGQQHQPPWALPSTAQTPAGGAGAHPGLNPTGLPFSPFWHYYAAFAAGFSASAQQLNGQPRAGPQQPAASASSLKHLSQASGLPGMPSPGSSPWAPAFAGLPGTGAGQFPFSPATQGFAGAAAMDYGLDFGMALQRSGAYPRSAPADSAWPVTGPMCAASAPPAAGWNTARSCGEGFLSRPMVAAEVQKGACGPVAMASGNQFITPPPLRLFHDAASRQHLVSADMR